MSAAQRRETFAEAVPMSPSTKSNIQLKGDGIWNCSVRRSIFGEKRQVTEQTCSSTSGFCPCPPVHTAMYLTVGMSTQRQQRHVKPSVKPSATQHTACPLLPPLQRSNASRGREERRTADRQIATWCVVCGVWYALVQSVRCLEMVERLHQK